MGAIGGFIPVGGDRNPWRSSVKAALNLTSLRVASEKSSRDEERRILYFYTYCY